MKPVIQINGGIVVDDDAAKKVTQDGKQSLAGLDALMEAIEQRANYVGPVLEDILHMTHEVWPSSLRK